MTVQVKLNSTFIGTLLIDKNIHYVQSSVFLKDGVSKKGSLLAGMCLIFLVLNETTSPVARTRRDPVSMTTGAAREAATPGAVDREREV